MGIVCVAKFMKALIELATYNQRLSRLLVDAVDTLHHIASGTVDNPQRLAKKTLKHLISDFRDLQLKSEKQLTNESQQS